MVQGILLAKANETTIRRTLVCMAGPQGCLNIPALPECQRATGTLFSGWEEDFPPRDDFSDADQLRVGNDGIFMLAFFMAFLFNWIGFCLSFCLTNTIAGRYGAICGFGLSLIKWILIVRFSEYFTGYFNGQYWLWWIFLVLVQWGSSSSPSSVGTVRGPQDAAQRTLPHRTLPTGRYPQDAAHRTLPTGRYPQYAAHRTLPTGLYPQDAAHKTMQTECSTQAAAHRTLPTGLYPQDATHRTLPTGQHPQDSTHKTLPTRRCPQDNAHRMLHSGCCHTGCCPEAAAYRTLPPRRCPHDAAPHDAGRLPRHSSLM
ncbi:hypothetical protein NFI96_008084 [Prochilodus magdalenae]|nr:hypothetical protein NFI96_008084 [Prochilodus magdalenae]